MKTLGIVIPVYNESKRLNLTFQELRKGLPDCGLKLKEIIFVNDGSTDKTLDKLKKFKENLSRAQSRDKYNQNIKIKIINYQKNMGKGYAVRKGMLESSSDYTLMMDADISTKLSELRKFKKYIIKNQPVIVGTRKNGQAEITQAQPIYRQLLGKVFTFLSQLILNTWVSDFTCGFKLFHKRALAPVFASAVIDRWGYDSEILFLARIFGFKITEIAVIWHNDDRSKVNLIQAIIDSFSELLQIRYNDFKGLYRPVLTQRFINILGFSK